MSQRFKETAEEIKRSQSQGELADKLAKLSALPDGTVVPIPLELIDQSQNIRDGELDRTSDDFRQLVETIREVGVLQNPVVTVMGDKIVCVAGHRRLAALAELGEMKAACVIRHFEKLETKQIAQLLENVARKALYPLEIAEQLARLQSGGYSQTRLQELLGKDRKTIGRYQKIASWPENAKALVRAHPDRLRAGLLLQIASRSLSIAELVETLSIHAGLSKASRPVNQPPASRDILQRAETYLAKNDFSQRDQDLIRRVLGDLGLIPAQGGISDPTPIAVCSADGISDPTLATGRAKGAVPTAQADRKGAQVTKAKQRTIARSGSSRRANGGKEKRT